MKYPELYLQLSCLVLCLMFLKGVAATETIKDKTTYVVGTENISYYPHYDFVTSDKNSYVKSLLTEFADAQNIEFIYVALPIKRLQLALSRGVVDFAYPDNPKWQKGTAKRAQQKHYSQPLTIAMGSTMVKREDLGRNIREFHSLAVPYGFAPILWMDKVTSRKVRLIEVKDAISALELVLRGRVDGADVEYHVANHIMQTTNISGLVMDPALPYDPVGFSLSSIHHPDLLLALNDFLNTSPELVKNLKAEFGLEEPQTILNRLTIK